LLCLQKDLILVICLTIIYFCLYSIASGQKAPDSLLIAVKTSNGTEKVDALNNLAEYTLRFSVKDGEHLLEQSQNMLENLNYKFGKAKSYQLLAFLYGNKGENQKALKLAENAASLYAEINKYEMQFYCKINQGSNYNSLGNNSKEIDCYLQALHLAEKVKRQDLQSSAASHLSLNFIKLDDRKNALDYASKALLLSRKSSVPKMIALANITMANYLNKFEKPENAKSFYLFALRIYANSNNPSGLSSAYIQYGHHFIKTSTYDSALFYYNNALKIEIASFNIMGQSSVITFIAHCYQLKHENIKALKYEKEALHLREVYGNMWLTGSSYCNVGTAYSKLQNFPKAIQYFTEGLRIAKSLNRIDYIKYTYQRIYDLYVSRKNFKQALKYNMLVGAINDSLLKTEIQQRFAEIKAKHTDEQKQRAVEFLRKENEIQKLKLKQINLVIYIMAISLVLFLVISILLILQSRLKAHQKQMDIEQNLLRSQMNPHFIFNALVAIQSFIYKKDSSEAAHYLTNFAKLIRLVLSNSQEEFVTLKREIETLSNYLSLQKLRFEDKFDYSLIVDPKLDTELIKIPPMLAQPFVENAIEHGVFGMDIPGRIIINFSLLENNVLIEVTDNGVGRAKGKELRKKSDKSHESYGTRITEERIQSHNRKYSSKLRLSIIDLFDKNNTPSGTRVIISIPNHGS
jgi:tetratricopeptide (TPR) repeat protein